ncbi:MAG: DUF1214 domain-containing protein [Actinomycetia bacterium]|nr:DUF1214 domain-containing protein [Actinomycetes bacterium]
MSDSERGGSSRKYAVSDPDIKYWPSRQWQTLPLHSDSEFDPDGDRKTDDLIPWQYRANALSPAGHSWASEGDRTVCLTSCREQGGGYLDGGRKYSLRIPPEVPAKQAWSITVHDPVPGPPIANQQASPGISSLQDHDINDNGSVDIHFGPTAPPGRELNWIQTMADTRWLAVFCLYVPLEAFLQRTWRLNDIFEVTWPSNPHATVASGS